MNRIFLSLGSNLGDRRHNLEKGIVLLKDRAGQIGAESALYETEPWGCSSNLTFYNQAVELFTIQDPYHLLKTIHEIESLCGREPVTIRFAPRPLDIDMLFFNDSVINKPGLVLPHPSLHLRRFVLVPLAEIAPTMVHPLLHKKVIQVLHDCTDDKKVIQRLG